MKSAISRRTVLQLGCSAAASPLFTPMVCAAAPGENRFIAIILRGAMDGLDVVQPFGDPAFAGLRPTLARRPGQGLLNLDGYFGLHDALEPLYPLWQSGELAFAQAVSTPYRQGRSHFDGQDILEAGSNSFNGTREGWLNRFIGTTPGTHETYAISVGRSPDLVLEGPQAHTSWSTQSDVTFSPDTIARFQRMYARDPLFSQALERALDIDTVADEIDDEDGTSKKSAPKLAAQLLRGDTRIASFSLEGWDTHISQKGTIQRPLRKLREALLDIKATLGPQIWSKTAIIAMTEFGRTARQNGALGTDHGTGGLAILAGGAIAGGRMYGNWPGLSEQNLYENRDLMPTDDIRRYPAWILRHLYGTSRTALEQAVFPGLDMGGELRIVRS